MFNRGMFVLLGGALLFGCDEESPPPGPPPTESCVLGGTFIVGEPALLDGSCDGHLPDERDLAVVPTDLPTAFRVRYLGTSLEGVTDSDCVLTSEAVTFDKDGLAATLALVVEVDEDRLAATVDFSLAGLGAGEICDVRYTLIGQRWDGEREGNPTGGSCGTGALCPNELCAFGEVSACAGNACLAQRIDEDTAVFCTEPCEIGSCPAGFVCELIDPWVYRSGDEWFCIIDVPVCGDAEVEGDEVCDDGNTTPGDGCSASCDSDESCGNDVWDEAVGEGCDDGNRVEGDGCNAFCALEQCGNDVLDEGEACDDGNLIAGDGCGVSCRFEGCGNGLLDPGEGCDDGNTIETDSCDGGCRVRPLLGKARVDAAWARQIAGAELANVDAHYNVVIGNRVLFAWSESYLGEGPFGAAREIFISSIGESDPFVRAPMRLAALSGWQLAGLVYRGGGDVVMLLRDGTSLALSTSSDGGGSFGAPVAFTVPGLPLHNAANVFAGLAGEGDNLYLTLGLQLVVVGDNRNLFLVRSADGGATWQDAVRLSPDPEFLGYASPPRLHVGAGGELVLVWADGVRGAGSVYAARSLDYGVTWLRLNERLGAHAPGRVDATLAALAGTSAGVLVAWAGPEGVRMARWDGTGSPWLFTTVARSDTVHPDLGPVGVAEGVSGDLYVAFASAAHVLMARSADGGSSFSSPVLVGALLPGTSVASVGPLTIVVDRELGEVSNERVVISYFADVDVAGERGWTPMTVASEDGGDSWSAVALPLLSASASADAKPGEWAPNRVGDRELAWTATGEHLWLVDIAEVQVAAPLEMPTGVVGSGCPQAIATGGWCVPSTIDAPSPRYGATAVVAGREMLVFGGHDGFRPLADGGIYDVAGDNWRAIDAGRAGVALSARAGHTAVWTGNEMIVFGGHNGLVPLADGGRFDPATETWAALPLAGAPAARSDHTAVWAGNEMIVFGGVGANGPLASGARYRPADDSWTPIAEKSDAAVSRHSAVVTATTMIVFGGVGAGNHLSDRGYRYQLGDDMWLPLPTAGVPEARAAHSALWTGAGMLVWGGTGRFDLADGGASWDLAGDAWSPLPSTGEPSARVGHVAVGRTTFNGTSTDVTGWIIWGGDAYSSGGYYDLATGEWTPTPTDGAPSGRADAVAAWVGHPLNRMVVFGGRDVDGAPLASGGILVPSGAN